MANILVADDDEQYPVMLAKILRSNHHHVVIAVDGQQALNFCKSQTFDLIITDILMPNFDGIDLIVNLIEYNSKVPIIAISGGRNTITAEFNLQSAHALGVQAALKKPFTNEKLFETVGRLLSH